MRLTGLAPVMVNTMKRDAWAVALLAVLCVALAAVITASGATPIVRSPDLQPLTPSVTQPTQREGSAVQAPSNQESRTSNFPVGLWVVLYALLIATLVVLWLIIWRPLKRRRAADVPESFTPSDLDTLDADAGRRLVDAIQQRLDDLDSGSPRNAVVACWLALEDAVCDLGFRRDPTLTALEFTQQVLAAYTVDEPAIGQLAALYREARFSVHTMTEQHRDAAAEALHTLREGLTRRSSVPDAESAS